MTQGPASRYHRQTLLPDIGNEGQARLSEAHALVVGCGALGCTAADLLARAGVGGLTLIDRDLVEETNLQRQVLFDQRHADERAPKAAAAAERIGEVNPRVRTEPMVVDFTSANAESVALNGALGPPDVLIDGTDNYETRFLINDLAVKHSLPFVYAGAVATEATTMAVLPGETPCLRCLFDGPPPPGSQPTCDTAGVLGPLISIVSGIQAGEAMKILIGRRDLVRRTLLRVDPWQNTVRELDLAGRRAPACVCCGGRRFEHLDRPAGDPVALCGRDAVQVSPPAPGRMDLDALAGRLSAQGEFERTRFLVRGKISGTGLGLTVFADGRAIVDGTTEPAEARAIYARYIGS
jgi:molybdopterin/thiamine biosynthesis adenylyltransferase